MFWTQLDWLSVWAFSSSLTNPGVWEAGSLVGAPSLGLMGIVTGFFQVDAFLLSSGNGPLNQSLLG
jgi:hypothetical protein